MARAIRPDTDKPRAKAKADAAKADAPKEKSAVKELLALAQARFEAAADADSKRRKEELEDREFFDDDQWDPQIKQARLADSRPCLTINKLKQPIKQTTNQQRDARPAIQVNPVDNGADIETAEIYQGIIRNIETNSHAEVVYGTAGKNQVVSGLGFVRVLTQYATETSFDQDIILKRVPEPSCVYWDPACQEMDFSDARYMFVTQDLPEAEYRRQFPDSALAGLNDWGTPADGTPAWFPDGGVRIAEYFSIEDVDDPIALVQIQPPPPFVLPGMMPPQPPAPPAPQTRVFRVAELPLPDGLTAAANATWQGKAGETYMILAMRTAAKRTVKWYKLNAIEVLEEQDWHGKYIPIVPVLGDEFWVKGRRQMRGMVRGARDAQRNYNYHVNAAVETIALAPRAPWIMAEGQDEDFEEMWAQSNTRNFPAMKYKPVTIDGILAPPPRRESTEPPIQALTVAIRQAEADIRATTAFYDPTNPQRSPDESGKAILARQRQGEMTNSDFLDNLGIAIRHVGRILIDLIPKIYDAPRVLRILGLDDQAQTVTVHAGKPPQDPPAQVGSVSKIYDLSVGRYDVTITVGPSYESRRQEAVGAMIQFVQAYPQVFPLIGDLLAANMDWPGAQQISKRLKTIIPPQAQDQDPNGAPPLPPQVQQQFQQLTQRLQQAEQFAGQAQQELKTQQGKLDADLQKAQIAAQASIEIQRMRDATAIAVAQIQAQAKGVQSATEAQNEAIALHLEQQADAQSQALSHAHDVGMSQLEHAQTLTMPPPPQAAPPQGL